MWGCLKFAYEAPNWTTPNRISLNRTMWSQTEACLTKLSCEISTLLGYYTTLSGNFFTNGSGQPISPILKGQKIQKNRAQLRITNTLLLGTLSTVRFFKEAGHFGSWLCFYQSHLQGSINPKEQSTAEVNWHNLFFKEAGHLKAKWHVIWRTPQIELFSITGHHRNSYLLRYAAEKKCSPRVS